MAATKQKFILAIDSASTPQIKNAITEFLMCHPTFNMWHWIDNVWLIIVDDTIQMTEQSLRAKIIAHIGWKRRDCQFFTLINATGTSKSTGYGTEESANWMKKHWNED